MSQDFESRVRARAHAIWLEDGCPEGRAEEHWARAADAVRAEDEAAKVSAPAAAAKKRAPAKKAAAKAPVEAPAAEAPAPKKRAPRKAAVKA
jgi:hypothetical protein